MKIILTTIFFWTLVSQSVYRFFLKCIVYIWSNNYSSKLFPYTDKREWRHRKSWDDWISLCESKCVCRFFLNTNFGKSSFKLLSKQKNEFLERFKELEDVISVTTSTPPTYSFNSTPKNFDDDDWWWRMNEMHWNVLWTKPHVGISFGDMSNVIGHNLLVEHCIFWKPLK